MCQITYFMLHGINDTLFGVPTSANPLAVQLQTVVRIIGGRNALGVKRQVFYVSLGGFDTHDFQRTNQADLLARLAHAMAYFDTALASLSGADMRKQVTLTWALWRPDQAATPTVSVTT